MKKYVANMSLSLYYEFDAEEDLHCWYDAEDKSQNAHFINAQIYDKKHSFQLALEYFTDKIEVENLGQEIKV